MRETESGAENILNHIAGVGADRDHLAVRHVDDSHQAERDRQAERDDEQNRAETEAAKDRAEEVDPGNVLFDGLDCGALGASNFGAGFRIGRKALKIIQAADGLQFASFLAAAIWIAGSVSLSCRSAMASLMDFANGRVLFPSQP